MCIHKPTHLHIARAVIRPIQWCANINKPKMNENHTIPHHPKSISILAQFEPAKHSQSTAKAQPKHSQSTAKTQPKHSQSTAKAQPKMPAKANQCMCQPQHEGTSCWHLGSTPGPHTIQKCQTCGWGVLSGRMEESMVGEYSPAGR